MSVSTTISKISYTGNGTLVGPYSFPYYASASTDIAVYLAGVLQSSGYTVSGSGSSWTVTFSTAPANGTSIVIKRSTARTQTSDYVENDAIPAAVVEGDFDKGVAIDQEIQTEIDRSIKLPVDQTPSAANTTLPVLVANKLIGLDANKELKYYTPGESVPSDASGVTFTQSGTGAVETTVEAKLYEHLSVKDFGATGDGVTDDTASIATAVTAWTAAGGVLKFPKGTYNTTGTIDFPMSSEGVHSLEIEAGATINYSGSSYCIDCDGDGEAYSNVRIFGGGSIYCGASTLAAIRLKAFNRGTVQDLYIKGTNSGDGIQIAGANTILIDNCDVRTFDYGIRGFGNVVSSVSYGAIGINVIGGHLSNNDLWGIYLENSGSGESCQSWNIQTIFDPNGSNDANSGNVWIQQGVAINVQSHMEYGPLQYGDCAIRIGDASNHPQATRIEGCVIGSVNSTYSIEDYGVGTQLHNNAETAAVTAFVFSGSGSGGRIFGKNIFLAAGGAFAGTDAGDTFDIGNSAGLVNSLNPTAFGIGISSLTGIGGAVVHRMNSAAYTSCTIFKDPGGSEIGRISRNLRGSVNLVSGTATVTFATNEADSGYYIALSGSANETFNWSSKGVSGFTITSSNGASTATVDWILIH